MQDIRTHDQFKRDLMFYRRVDEHLLQEDVGLVIDLGCGRAPALRNLRTVANDIVTYVGVDMDESLIAELTDKCEPRFVFLHKDLRKDPIDIQESPKTMLVARDLFSGDNSVSKDDALKILRNLAAQWPFDLLLLNGTMDASGDTQMLDVELALGLIDHWGTCATGKEYYILLSKKQLHKNLELFSGALRTCGHTLMCTKLLSHWHSATELPHVEPSNMDRVVMPYHCGPKIPTSIFLFTDPKTTSDEATLPFTQAGGFGHVSCNANFHALADRKKAARLALNLFGGVAVIADSQGVIRITPQQVKYILSAFARASAIATMDIKTTHLGDLLIASTKGHPWVSVDKNAPYTELHPVDNATCSTIAGPIILIPHQ